MLQKQQTMLTLDVGFTAKHYFTPTRRCTPDGQRRAAVCNDMLQKHGEQQKRWCGQTMLIFDIIKTLYLHKNE